MTRKQKRSLIKIIIAGVLFIISLVLPIDNKYLKLAVSLVPFAAAGYSVLWKSVRNIIRGQIFDENFLMSIAALGSFVSGYLSGSGDYAEGTAVMLFYQVGALFESIAVGRSRKSIASLMDIRPDSANLVMPDGSLQETDPEEVPVGSVIAVRAGERIPIDGVVIEGSTGIDTAALTGESAPRDVSVGDEVVSGCVNINGLIKIRTTKVFAESTVSKILEMVESSAVKKSKAESFITRFARYYTPIVVFSALALAVIPSLITGQPLEWINRALIFLVISCPCALVIFRTDDNIDDWELAYNYGKTSGSQWKVMPKKYVIDAVEILKNSSKGIDLATKRLYDDLDAGYTNIEAASGYTGEIMYRKTSSRRGKDGHKILQDTNNSTVDFNVSTTIGIREYDE